MTRKTRFASSGIMLLSLTASLFSLTAQAQVLESSLGNLGRAVDNLLPLELEPTTTLLGQSLDNSVLEYVDFEVALEVSHNLIHSWLKPEQVLSPALQLAHESLDSLSDTVAATDLPLQARQAASGLLHGIGDTVLSTGGLLYDVPNEPNPLTSILGHATNGIASATQALFQGTAQGTSLTNRSSRHTVSDSDIQQEKNFAPIRFLDVYEKTFQQYLAQGGFDNTEPIVSPVLHNAQDQIHSLGDVLASTELPLQAGQAAGGLLHGLSGAVESVNDFLYPDTQDTSALASLLGHTTNGIAAATDALLQGNTLLSPLPTLSPDSVSRTSLNTGTTDGLLAPVTNVLAGLDGNGDTSNGGLLATVTGLLGGLLPPLAEQDGRMGPAPPS
ncbi:hypothetical protein [Alcaligenes nematophilus]|uniref:hypothetical protein n=1 Tax=Alcaligenes nematophilus TaxID=2994643 RepID=UPI00384D4777